jgi:hypothetical protein
MVEKSERNDDADNEEPPVGCAVVVVPLLEAEELGPHEASPTAATVTTTAHTRARRMLRMA